MALQVLISEQASLPTLIPLAIFRRTLHFFNFKSVMNLTACYMKKITLSLTNDLQSCQYCKVLVFASSKFDAYLSSPSQFCAS